MERLPALADTLLASAQRAEVVRRPRVVRLEELHLDPTDGLIADLHVEVHDRVFCGRDRLERKPRPGRAAAAAAEGLVQEVQPDSGEEEGLRVGEVPAEEGPGRGLPRRQHGKQALALSRRPGCVRRGSFGAPLGLLWGSLDSIDPRSADLLDFEQLELEEEHRAARDARRRATIAVCPHTRGRAVGL